MHEAGDELDLDVFPANNERLERQLAAPINVILGNPPYSVGQGSANDLNANLAYPSLDARIAETYAARSTATNKNSLYDSYLRAFRWATDRIGDAGVVAFVSNGGWIDGNTADGIRLSLADEFARIYVYNLRGNQRTAGELSRREGGKVFGGGSRNTIAIWVGVKDPAHTGACEVFYHDIGDHLSREEKLRRIAAAELGTLDWRRIVPNVHGDWVQQRSADFGTWPVVGTKKTGGGVTVFTEYSRGLATGRDAWCYSFARSELEHHVTDMTEQFAAAATEFSAWCAAHGLTSPKEADVTRFLATRPDLTGPGSMSWNRGIKLQLARGHALPYRTASHRMSTYRPFCAQHAYFDRQLNDMIYQLPRMFPTAAHDNVGIVLTGAASHFAFTPFITDLLPNLHTLDTGQFFPRWTWEPVDSPEGELDFGSPLPAAAQGSAGEVRDEYRRVDNVTDTIRDVYASSLGVAVDKDDIFFFVYGLLHDPAYREAYAADLKKTLPHIPTPTSPAYFAALAAAGRRLAELHVGYERVEPWPITVELKPGADPEDRQTWRVVKMRRPKGDPTRIVYNPRVTISGIPAEAEDYLLGSRSALGWIIDRYQVKTDKASGIVNDPNLWCAEHDDPRYIVDLIARVTRVAVETVGIVAEIAALEP